MLQRVVACCSELQRRVLCASSVLALCLACFRLHVALCVRAAHLPYECECGVWCAYWVCVFVGCQETIRIADGRVHTLNKTYGTNVDVSIVQAIFHVHTIGHFDFPVNQCIFRKGKYALVCGKGHGDYALPPICANRGRNRNSGHMMYTWMILMGTYT